MPEKTRIPEPPDGMIERNRLISQIRSHPTARLVVLTAPGGYGKTIVAAQTLARIPVDRKAWLRLDQHDADPAQFMTYLIEALSNGIADVRRSGIQDRPVDQSSNARQALEDICISINEFVKRECWIVLDNFELIAESSDIAELVMSLSQECGGKLRIIVASRTMPRGGLARLEEQGKALIHRSADLAFTLEEFKGLADKSTGIPLDEKHTQQLWDKTGGWCVAARMLLKTTEPSSQGRPKKGSGSLHNVVALGEYVQEEFLSKLTPGLQKFLVRTSPLVTLETVGLKALGYNEATITDFLHQIRESALPLTRSNGSEHLSLHSLIRDELVNDFLRETGSKERNDTLITIAEHLASVGMLLEGCRCLLWAEQYTATLEMLDRHWKTVTDSNLLEQVEQMLEEFPTDHQLAPLMIKHRAVILGRSGRYRSLRNYLKDKLNPEILDDGSKVLGSVWIHYHWASISEMSGMPYKELLDDWGRIAEETDLIRPSNHIGANFVLGHAAERELNLLGALEHVERARKHIETESSEEWLICDNNQALYRHSQGYSRESLNVFTDRLQYLERKKSYSLCKLFLWNIMEVHFTMGHYRQTLGSANFGEAFAQRHNLSLVAQRIAIMRCRGLAHWYLGDRNKAWTLLKESMSESNELGAVEKVISHAIISFLEFAEHGVASDNEVDPQTIPQSGEARLIWYGYFALKGLATGDLLLTDRSIESISHIACFGNMRPWKMTACVLRAMMSDRRKDRETENRQLFEALKILEELGWHSFPLCCEPLQAALIVQAVRYDVNLETVEKLFAAEYRFDYTPHFRKTISDSSDDIELTRLFRFATRHQIRGLDQDQEITTRFKGKTLERVLQDYTVMAESASPATIEVKALGGTEIVVLGNNAVFKRRKSRELFQALLLSYPRPLHEEELMEMLWPETEVKRSKMNLRACVSDARTALDPYYRRGGISFIDYKDECYSCFLPDGTTVDLFEFERAVPEAIDNVRKAPNNEVCVDELRKSLNIFQGDLLPKSMYEEYTMARRERVRILYLDGLIALAEAYVHRNEHRAACHSLEKGISLDPLWCEGIQKLMGIFGSLGQRFRAVQVYRKYEQLLDTELGVGPDASLMQLYEELVRPTGE
ncbi:MAG: BTAD domain-containing putative transcriptional regulator [Candidatus Zixiibacteriota bacterium]